MKTLSLSSPTLGTWITDYNPKSGFKTEYLQTCILPFLVGLYGATFQVRIQDRIPLDMYLGYSHKWISVWFVWWYTMDYNPKSGFKTGYHQTCILDFHTSGVLYSVDGELSFDATLISCSLYYSCTSQDLNRSTEYSHKWITVWFVWYYTMDYNNKSGFKTEYMYHQTCILDFHTSGVLYSMDGDFSFDATLI